MGRRQRWGLHGCWSGNVESRHDDDWSIINLSADVGCVREWGGPDKREEFL